MVLLLSHTYLRAWSYFVFFLFFFACFICNFFGTNNLYFAEFWRYNLPFALFTWFLSVFPWCLFIDLPKMFHRFSVVFIELSMGSIDPWFRLILTCATCTWWTCRIYLGWSTIVLGLDSGIWCYHSVGWFRFYLGLVWFRVCLGIVGWFKVYLRLVRCLFGDFRVGLDWFWVGLQLIWGWFMVGVGFILAMFSFCLGHA